MLTGQPTMLAELHSDGILRTPTGDDYRHRLAGLRREAFEFFGRPADVKNRYQSRDLQRGYRPTGIEYSATADFPDQNEAYAFWTDSAAHLAEVGGAEAFSAALGEFAEQCAVLGQGILDSLAREFDYRGKPLKFREFSYLQVNYTSAELAADLIQDRHEDGHLVTIHNASGPGLILHPDGRDEVPVAPDEYAATVLPGSTLTLMTGGIVPPMYHSVRAMTVGKARLAVMYFMNLDPTEPIEPYVLNDTNRHVDIADHIDRFPMNFGLPRLTDR